MHLSLLYDELLYYEALTSRIVECILNESLQLRLVCHLVDSLTSRRIYWFYHYRESEFIYMVKCILVCSKAHCFWTIESVLLKELSEKVFVGENFHRLIRRCW